MTFVVHNADRHLRGDDVSERNWEWRGFAHRHWERQCYAGPIPQSYLPSLTPDDVFRIVVEVAASTQAGFRFYSPQGGWRSTVQSLDGVLPKQSDDSLEGYDHRLTAAGYANYCLVCNHVPAKHAGYWKTVRQFIKPLCKHIGVVCDHVNSGFMFGRYPKTPFGVHVDHGRSAFIFPLAGIKKYRLWRSDVVRRSPGLPANYADVKYAADTEYVTGAPGELVYWPAEMWHIAEADNDFTMMVSIGLMSCVICARQAERGGANDHIADMQMLPLPTVDADGRCEPPSDVQDMLQNRTVWPNSVEKADALTAAWLRVATSYNMRTAIPERDCDAVRSDKHTGFVIAQDSLLLWAPVADGRGTVLGANGHVHFTRMSPGLAAAVCTHLNQRSPTSVAEIADAVGAANDPIQLVKWLRRIHLLDEVVGGVDGNALL